MKPFLLGLLVFFAPFDKTVPTFSGGEIQIFRDGTKPIEVRVVDHLGNSVTVRLSDGEADDVAQSLVDVQL